MYLVGYTSDTIMSHDGRRDIVMVFITLWIFIKIFFNIVKGIFCEMSNKIAGPALGASGLGVPGLSWGE